MAMAEHIHHKNLGKYEGHPVITPLQDAEDHLREALIRANTVGTNLVSLAEKLERIKHLTRLIEDKYGKKEFVH